jgi:hypothetical protein
MKMAIVLKNLLNSWWSLNQSDFSTYVQQVDVPYLPRLLDIWRKFSIVEAEAVILERQGEITSAYDLLFRRHQDSIKQLFV